MSPPEQARGKKPIQMTQRRPLIRAGSKIAFVRNHLGWNAILRRERVER
jgi:hypothetical protein